MGFKDTSSLLFFNKAPRFTLPSCKATSCSTKPQALALLLYLTSEMKTMKPKLRCLTTPQVQGTRMLREPMGRTHDAGPSSRNQAGFGLGIKVSPRYRLFIAAVGTGVGKFVTPAALGFPLSSAPGIGPRVIFPNACWPGCLSHGPGLWHSPRASTTRTAV